MSQNEGFLITKHRKCLVYSRVVHEQAIRLTRPIHLEKQEGLNNVFQKNLKYGQVIPARQDK